MPTGPSVPDAPAPVPEEVTSGVPEVVLDGERYAIGWQRYPDEQGGPAYVTTRRGILGGRSVLGRYPLTSDGWALAWGEFARLDPATAEKTRVALGRLYAVRPPAGVLAFVPGLVLSAIDPPAEAFVVGQAYDVRFGDDGLRIARSGSPDAVAAEYRYADVAAVQVTGFERVLTASKVQLLFWPGATRPAEFYEYRTRLRVHAGDRTLDFWHAVLPGKMMYRWLEPVNRAIWEAWLSAAEDKAGRRTEWLVTELSRLAERLEHNTLTRSDFDLLKARIIGGS